MEPAEPAAGGGRRPPGRTNLHALGGGGSKESAPVPHPEGSREAPEREVNASPCQSTGR